MALIPIYPSLGFKNDDGVIIAHFLRSAGTDLNMPLALALVAFVFVEFWGLRMRGFGYLGKFIPIGEFVRNVRRGQVFQGLVGLFVGFLEGTSEVVRIVSFTFRLFGNMTAGEVLVLTTAFLVPFVAAVAVYGLEILVGGVQALIFAGLTLVFVTVAITPAEEEH
jgi:F-type H+-transporting ATPase subunit a